MESVTLRPRVRVDLYSRVGRRLATFGLLAISGKPVAYCLSRHSQRFGHGFSALPTTSHVHRGEEYRLFGFPN